MRPFCVQDVQRWSGCRRCIELRLGLSPWLPCRARVGVAMPHYLLSREALPAGDLPVPCQDTWMGGCSSFATSLSTRQSLLLSGAATAQPERALHAGSVRHRSHHALASRTSTGRLGAISVLTAIRHVVYELGLPSPIMSKSPSDRSDNRLSIASGVSRSIQLFPLFNPLSMPETAALWTFVLLV